jgi:hypothetical protein
VHEFFLSFNCLVVTGSSAFTAADALVGKDMEADKLLAEGRGTGFLVMCPLISSSKAFMAEPIKLPALLPI